MEEAERVFSLLEPYLIEERSISEEEILKRSTRSHQAGTMGSSTEQGLIIHIDAVMKCPCAEAGYG